MDRSEVAEQFTPENVAVLKQALVIIHEVSHASQDYTGPFQARDARAICRAEVAASALSSLLIGVSIHYDLGFMTSTKPTAATA